MQDNSQEPLSSDEAIFVRELLQLIDENVRCESVAFS